MLVSIRVTASPPDVRRRLRLAVARPLDLGFAPGPGFALQEMNWD